jgi:hypothetical protein
MIFVEYKPRKVRHFLAVLMPEWMATQVMKKRCTTRALLKKIRKNSKHPFSEQHK